MTKYKIMYNDDHKEVDGELFGDHIGVHKERFDWTITHLPTGRAACRLPTEKGARIVAESIAAAFDWSTLDNDGKGTPKTIVAYLMKVGGSHRPWPLGGEPEKAPRVSFCLDLGDACLTVEELWPDGDWPDDPTADDVRALISKCGGANTVVGEWDLLSEIEVSKLG